MALDLAIPLSFIPQTFSHISVLALSLHCERNLFDALASRFRNEQRIEEHSERTTSRKGPHAAMHSQHLDHNREVLDHYEAYYPEERGAHRSSKTSQFLGQDLRKDHEG